MIRTEVLIRSGDVTRVLTGLFVFFLPAIVFVLLGSSQELSRLHSGGLFVRSCMETVMCLFCYVYRRCIRIYRIFDETRYGCRRRSREK